MQQHSSRRRELRTGDVVLLNFADLHGGPLQYVHSAQAGPDSHFSELCCSMRPPVHNAPRTDSLAFRLVARANDDQVSRSLLQQEGGDPLDLSIGVDDVGSPIHYGQHVRLEHVHSGRLLSISPNIRGRDRFSMGIALQPDAVQSGANDVDDLAGGFQGVTAVDGNSFRDHVHKYENITDSEKRDDIVGAEADQDTSLSFGAQLASGEQASVQGENFLNSWFQIKRGFSGQARRAGDIGGPVRVSDIVVLRNSLWRRFLCARSASRPEQFPFGEGEVCAKLEPSRFTLVPYHLYDDNEAIDAATDTPVGDALAKGVVRVDTWVRLHHLESQAVLTNEPPHIDWDASEVGNEGETAHAVEANFGNQASPSTPVAEDTTTTRSRADTMKVDICWNCGKRPNPPHLAADCTEPRQHEVPGEVWLRSLEWHGLAATDVAKGQQKSEGVIAGVGGDLLSIWQLESERSERDDVAALDFSGELVHPHEENYRLRHIATGHVLAIEEGGSELGANVEGHGSETQLCCLSDESLASMSRDEADRRCLFRVVVRSDPGAQNVGVDQLNSHFPLCLQHKATKHWLCCGQSMEVAPDGATSQGSKTHLISRVLNEGDSLFHIVPVSTAEKRQILPVIRATTCINSRLAVVQERVSTGDLCRTSDTAPLSSVLRDLTALLQTAYESSLLETSDVRGDMRTFDAAGSSLSHLQNLLRELRVAPQLLSALMEILGCTSRVKNSLTIAQLQEAMHEPLRRVFAHSLAFVGLSVRRNLRSKLALSRYIRFIQTLLKGGQQLYVSEVLSELFRDNRRFSTRHTEEHVMHTVQLIRQPGGALPELVDFLHQLCSHDGVALPDNQALVRDSLSQYSDALLPRVRSTVEDLKAGDRMALGESITSSQRGIRSKASWVVEFPSAMASNMVTSSEMCTELSLHAVPAHDDYLRLMHYYTAMIRLLAQLARGRNETSQQIVCELVGLSFANIVEILEDNTILSDVRTAFCEYALHVFVDREPHHVVQHISLVRTVGDQVARNARVQEPTDIEMPKLFDCVMRFLRISSFRVHGWAAAPSVSGHGKRQNGAHSLRQVVNVHIALNRLSNRAQKSAVSAQTKKHRGHDSMTTSVPLLLQMLKLCRMMVSFGLPVCYTQPQNTADYTQAEVRARHISIAQRIFDILLDILASLIEKSSERIKGLGDDDVTKPANVDIAKAGSVRATSSVATGVRKSQQDRNVHILDEHTLFAMLEACHMLGTLLDIQCEGRLSLLVERARSATAWPQSTSVERVDSTVHSLVLGDTQRSDAAFNGENAPQKYLPYQVWQDILHEVRLDRRKRFVAVCLDLTQFRQPSLTSRAFGLLFRRYDGPRELLRAGQQVSLIQPEDATLHSRVASVVAQLRRLAAMQRDDAWRARLCELVDGVTTSLAERDANTSLPTESARNMERMLTRYDGAKAVLAVLASPQHRVAPCSVKELESCCRLLHELLLIHPARNQDVLFPYITLLAQQMSRLPKLIGALIVMIFFSNLKLMRLVSEAQVQLIVRCVSRGHVPGSEDFLHVLRHMVFCRLNDRLVLTPRNQNMVLNHLFRDAPSVFDIFAGGGLLERCLAAGNMDSCVELFQLLSVCALNRNHFAQVQCRSIVSFEHIACAVADISAPLALKWAMLQFLDANFFDVRVHVRGLFASNALWDFLSFCAGTIEQLVHDSRSGAEVNEDEMKEGSSTASESLTHEHFVFECVLRACYHFFTRYYHDRPPLTQQQQSVSSALRRSVADALPLCEGLEDPRWPTSWAKDLLRMLPAPGRLDTPQRLLVQVQKTSASGNRSVPGRAHRKQVSFQVNFTSTQPKVSGSSSPVSKELATGQTSGDRRLSTGGTLQTGVALRLSGASEVAINADDIGIEMVNRVEYVENKLFQHDLQGTHLMHTEESKVRDFLASFEARVRGAGETAPWVAQFRENDEFVSRLVAQLDSVGRSAETNVDGDDGHHHAFALMILRNLVQDSVHSRIIQQQALRMMESDPVGFGMTVMKTHPWDRDVKLCSEQRRLSRLGASEMVLRLVLTSARTDGDSRILREALLLGIELLRGGNAQVQEEMRQHLAENFADPFFLAVVRILRTSTDAIREHRQHQRNSENSIEETHFGGKRSIMLASDTDIHRIERARSVRDRTNSLSSDSSPADTPQVDSENEAVAGTEQEVTMCLLEFLQLMCSKQFTPLQHMMADHNVLDEVVTYLLALRQEGHGRLVSSHCCKVLRAISAFALGCPRNKKLLSSKRSLGTIVMLLPRAQQGKEQGKERRSTALVRGRNEEVSEECQAAVITALHSLLEGCHENTVVQHIVENVSAHMLLAYCKKLKKVQTSVSSQVLRNTTKRAAAAAAAAVLSVTPIPGATSDADGIPSATLRAHQLREFVSNAIVMLSTLRDLAWSHKDYTDTLDKALDCLREDKGTTQTRDWLKSGVPLVTSVEIMRDGELERIYFPVPALCRKHWADQSVQDSVFRLKYEIRMDNHGARLQQFHECCGYLLLEMAYSARVAASQMRGRITRDDKLWKAGTLCTAVVVNIFNGCDAMELDHGSVFRWCGLFVASLHLLLGTISVAANFISRKQKIKNAHYERNKQTDISRGTKASEESEMLSRLLDDDDASLGLQVQTSNSKLIAGGNTTTRDSTAIFAGTGLVLPSQKQGDAEDSNTQRLRKKLEAGQLSEEEYASMVEGDKRWEDERDEKKPAAVPKEPPPPTRVPEEGVIGRWDTMWLLALDSKYEIILLLLSLVGFIAWLHDSNSNNVSVRLVLYSFTLLDGCTRRQELQRILSAVTTNNISLLYTGLLAVIVIYIYSGLGWAFYSADYDVTRDFGDESESIGCRTFVECLLTHLNYGLRDDQGIGDVMSVVDLKKESFGRLLGRVVFDVSYWIIIVVMLLSIVSGIIIDTFGQLRDKKNSVDALLARRCFICGIDSNSFQRQGHGFDYHVRNEHNMWAYLFIRQYLREKDPRLYTGQERYLATMVQDGDMSYMPMGVALALSQ